MKQSEVEVGATYIIWHGGGECRVKVLEIQKTETRRYDHYTRPSHTYYRCLKFKTGKEILVKSAVKFRVRADDARFPV